MPVFVAIWPRLSPWSFDRTAERAGLAGRYTGHSLRRGGAAAARKAGHDLVTIARHGRWKDGSPVLLGYLEDANRWTDNPMQGVGLKQISSLGGDPSSSRM
jgi:integrase